MLYVKWFHPGSYRDDRVTKFFEYEKAKVPEYWFIDPIRKDAIIYALNDKEKYEHYPTDDRKRLQSSVLKEFVLDPQILWQDKLPEGIEVLPLVQAMLEQD